MAHFHRKLDDLYRSTGILLDNQRQRRSLRVITVVPQQLLLLAIVVFIAVSSSCGAYRPTTTIHHRRNNIKPSFRSTSIVAPTQASLQRPTWFVCAAQRRRDDDDEYDDDDDYEEYVSERRRQRRESSRRNNNIVDDLGDFRDRTGLDLPSSYGRRDGWRLPDSVSKSLLAGVFVLGIGLGVTIDSQVNTNPKDLASRDAIDNAAPNPTLCAKLGASALALDQRIFVSFNPFNVYVSQADVKPACVLREANIVPVLKARGLINDDEVRSCKLNMNTWAFVGSLDDTPQLSCVYKSQDAQNEFLSNPKVGLGEDYLDRGDGTSTTTTTNKVVKGSLTEAQKQLIRDQTTTAGPNSFFGF